MEGIIALLIPIIALSIPIVAIWTKHQQKIAEMQVGATAEHTAEKAAQYASHIQRLEDRVQVLDRIVTDRGLRHRNADRSAARHAQGGQRDG